MEQDSPIQTKKIPVPPEVWEIIEKGTIRALEMLNSSYKTDGGRDVHDYYKGYLASLTNLKGQLELVQEPDSLEEATGESDKEKTFS